MSLAVSVQICTLNEERNIRDCLVAVIANDPEEVIVIDGGSTDATVSTAEGLGARVMSPGRLGLGPSRRLGYLASNSTYTAFVDADYRLGPDWLATMLGELVAGGYSALQSSLRVPEPSSFWARGWDQYFIESVRQTADTNMVGRPALFVTADLQADPTEFASLDEDTHMSRAFELRGLRQGIGTAVTYRFCEETYDENVRKWRSYGRGYRGFVLENPDRRRPILRHMLWTVPVSRSVRPVLRGKVLQPVFGALMAGSIVAGWRSSAAKP